MRDGIERTRRALACAEQVRKALFDCVSAGGMGAADADAILLRMEKALPAGAFAPWTVDH